MLERYLHFTGGFSTLKLRHASDKHAAVATAAAAAATTTAVVAADVGTLMVFYIIALQSPLLISQRAVFFASNGASFFSANT
jgi:hypothetical protein